MLPTLAIDVGRRRLRAVLVRPGASTTVLKSIGETAPERLDVNDPAALGTWVGSTLRQHGVPLRSATFALNREQVSMKRLTLPTIDRDELPDMVRNAMQRELPIDPAVTVIDFVPVERDATSTTVLAFAAPQSVLDFTTAVAQAAGVRVDRLSLRCFGTAALLRDTGDRATVAIDLTTEGIELSVLLAGQLVFSRGVELRGDGVEPRQFADAIATEVRRSWASYRISRERDQVTETVLLADARMASLCTTAIAEVTGSSVRCIDRHDRVRTGDIAPGECWALVGMLLEPRLRLPMLDFARPRRAPDLAARTRQGRLLAVGAVVVAAMCGWTIGGIQAARLQSLHDQRYEQATTAKPEADRFNRDQVKLKHLRTWSALREDWLADLLAVREMMPAPGDGVLDTFAATSTIGGVEWKKDKGWNVTGKITIGVVGQAQTREIADAYRDRLVHDDRFLVKTLGTDAPGGSRLPFSFSYQLEALRAAGDGVEHGADSAKAPVDGQAAKKPPAREKSAPQEPSRSNADSEAQP